MAVALGVMLLLMLTLGAAAMRTRELAMQMARVVEGNNKRPSLAQRVNAAQLDWLGQLHSLMLVSEPDDLKFQDRELLDARQRYLSLEAELTEALAIDDGTTAAMRSKMDQVHAVPRTWAACSKTSASPRCLGGDQRRRSP